MSMTRSTWLTLAVLLVVVVALVSLTAVAGCSKTNTSGAAVGAAEASGTVYTCPMHPEVVSKSPGQCPKCHMDLVKKGK